MTAHKPIHCRIHKQATVVVTDAGTDWHRNRSRGAGPRQNALYYPDWRADWNIEISTEELERFLADVQKFGGGMP